MVILQPHLILRGHIIAAYGPSACFRDLYWYREHEPEAQIYTNFVNALSFEFSWDMVKNECAAYIRNSEGIWMNIQDMTARELRFAHNIPKLRLKVLLLRF